jgi:hypothetical protein
VVHREWVFLVEDLNLSVKISIDRGYESAKFYSHLARKEVEKTIEEQREQDLEEMSEVDVDR